ncbi:MAG: hypothetical protein NTY64_04130, partial [Deltaproteobacteria bacterium]|nr:hypothetical protein [Deltaproteobacteria bacterium]
KVMAPINLKLVPFGTGSDLLDQPGPVLPVFLRTFNGFQDAGDPVVFGLKGLWRQLRFAKKEGDHVPLEINPGANGPCLLSRRPVREAIFTPGDPVRKTPPNGDHEAERKLPARSMEEPVPIFPSETLWRLGLAHPIKPGGWEKRAKGWTYLPVVGYNFLRI